MHEFYVVCDTSCHITWNTAYFSLSTFFYLSIYLCVRLVHSVLYCILCQNTNVSFLLFMGQTMQQSIMGVWFTFMKKKTERENEKEHFANKFCNVFTVLM